MLTLQVSKGAPHSGRGLPGACLSALKIHLFSSHAWGSFPLNDGVEDTLHVFPTRVGVVPDSWGAA
jgi:hypothetical protein